MPLSHYGKRLAFIFALLFVAFIFGDGSIDPPILFFSIVVILACEGIGYLLNPPKKTSNESTTPSILPKDNEEVHPIDDEPIEKPIYINYQLMRTKYKKAPAGAKLSLEKMTEYINYCVNDFISLYAYYLDEENRNPISSSFVVFLRCFPYDQQDYYKQRFINMLNRETYNESFIKSGKETAPIKIFIEDIFDEIEYKEYNDFTSNQLFHIVTQIQCWLLYALTLDDDKRILSVVADPYNQEQTYNKILEKTKSRVNGYDNSESIQSSAVYLRKTIYDDSTN